jgi:predicted lipid-binding transport protein (Tim44 family)
MRATATALAALLAAAALGACGGDDKGEVKQTVRAFVKATREGDADKFCNELVTKEFLEQSTGATGDQAKQNCRRQLESLKVNIELVDIKKVEVDGDEATATASLKARRQTRDQILRLKKEDGNWKLAGGSGQ